MEKPKQATGRSAVIFFRTQEGVVLGLVLLTFVLFALFLPAFFTPGNLISLVRSMSILGLLSLGMAMVVITRGVDISLIATMVVSVGWVLVLYRGGVPLGITLLLGAAFSILVGAAIGALIAYGEVPPIFATLAAGSVIYGGGCTWLFQLEMQNVPPDNVFFSTIGNGHIFGIPLIILIFAAFCLLVHLFLTHTRLGWILYAMGSSPAAARNTGFAMRPMTVALYAFTSLIAFFAGLLIASSTNSINARLYNSTMIYDILLIVVLGGIGLNGGHGRVRNVLLGAALVGILLNGMTILNVNFTTQNLVKGVVLLSAIVIDAILNPRDEQTSQQGDL